MNLVRQQRAPKQQQQAQQHVNNINTCSKASEQETPVQSNDNSGDVNNDGDDVANDVVDRGDNHSSDNHDSNLERATIAFFQNTDDSPINES